MKRTQFKGSYILPAAHCEMAVLLWAESCDPKVWPRPAEASESGDTTGQAPDAESPEVKEFRRAKVEEAQSWLDKAAKWESFVLDTRIGMRVQTGLEVLKWYQNKTKTSA